MREQDARSPCRSVRRATARVDVVDARRTRRRTRARRRRCTSSGARSAAVRRSSRAASRSTGGCARSTVASGARAVQLGVDEHRAGVTSHLPSTISPSASSAQDVGGLHLVPPDAPRVAPHRRRRRVAHVMWPERFSRQPSWARMRSAHAKLLFHTQWCGHRRAQSLDPRGQPAGCSYVTDVPCC